MWRRLPSVRPSVSSVRDIVPSFRGRDLCLIFLKFCIRFLYKKLSLKHNFLKSLLPESRGWFKNVNEVITTLCFILAQF